MMVLRMIILAQRLDRRRYGCDWCSCDDDNGSTQVRPMCMCAVMACGVSKQKLTASDGAADDTLA